MQVTPLLSVQIDMPSEFSDEVLRARADELEQMMLNYHLEHDDFGECGRDEGKERDPPLVEDGEVEDDGRFDFVTARERVNERVRKENKKEDKTVVPPPPPMNPSGRYVSLEHLEQWFHQTVTRTNRGASMAKFGEGDATADGASVNLLEQLQQAMMHHQQSAPLQAGECQPSKKRNNRKSCAEHSSKKSKKASNRTNDAKVANTKNKKQHQKKGAPAEKTASSTDDDQDEFHFSLHDSEDGSHDSESGDDGEADDDKQDGPKQPKKPASTPTSINEGPKGSKKVKQVMSTSLAIVPQEPRKPDVNSRTTWDEHFSNGSTEIYSDALVLKSNCPPITGTAQDVGRQAHMRHSNA